MNVGYGCSLRVLIFVLIVIKLGSTILSSFDKRLPVLEKKKIEKVNKLMISSLNNSRCCKKDCIITRSETAIATNCDGALCKCIPYEQIPDNTTKLSICNNKLVKIPKGSFEKFVDMEILLLSYNNIRTIDVRAFIGLQKLLLLDLSNNPELNILPDYTFSPLHSLQTLNFKSVSVFCDSFNPNVFYNSENLKNFSFSLNRQFSFPKFDVNHSSIMPSLDILDLSRNNLKELVRANFDHLKSVRVLLLNNNEIQSIGGMCFYAMLRLEVLNLEHNLIFKLKSSSFWSNSLQILNLTDSGLSIAKRDSFKQLPNLKHLILKKCTFLPSANMKHLFSNLTNLTRLNLQHCNLRSIQIKKLLKHLKHLDSLWLSGNYIVDLDKTIFEPFADSLKVLQLNDNKLTTINITSLPTKLWTSLDEMTLGGNPWNCDCGLIWFRIWLSTTNVTITDKVDPKRYTCAFRTKEIGSKQLTKLGDSTILKCFETKQDWWLVIVSACTFFICLTVFLASLLQRFSMACQVLDFLICGNVLFNKNNNLYSNSNLMDLWV